MPFTISNVTHVYEAHGFRPVSALHEVSITQIFPGEIVCIMGSNGAGKSTLIDKLAGKLGTQRGNGVYVLDDSQTVIIPGDQREFVHLYVPQKPQAGLIPSMDILENLMFRAHALKSLRQRTAYTKAEVVSFLSELDFLDFVEKLENSPEALSGGQQQLLNILSALFPRPDLLLLDEPTSKLDTRNRVRAWRTIVKAAKEFKISVICATHDAEMVERVADRVVVLEEGRIASTRTLRQIAAPRFAGDIRRVSRLADLPEPLRQGIDDEWWSPRPGCLFHSGYFEGDNSRIGYLAGRPLNREARTRREVEGVLGLLNLGRDASILDVPCGWGRHTNALSGAGYRAVGGDINESYLHLGRTDSTSATLVNLDMRVLPFRDGQFDAIVNMWTSFGFFSDDDNVAVFEEFRRVVRTNGKILLHSDLNPRRVRSGIFDEPPVRPLVGGGTLEVVEYFCEEDSRIYGSWRVRKDDHDTTSYYSIAIYSEERIRSIADSIGLEVIGIYGSLDLPAQPLTDASQEFLVVLRRI